jgi:hypothetical protein
MRALDQDNAATRAGLSREKKELGVDNLLSNSVELSVFAE